MVPRSIMKTSRALAPLALIFLLLPPGCASASSDSSSPDGRDGEDDAATSASSSSSSSSGAPTSFVGSNALLAEAQMIVRTMKSTAYQHTSNIDAMKGIYDVDCSGFVDYAMSKSAPDAYAALVEATVPSPVAQS